MRTSFVDQYIQYDLLSNILSSDFSDALRKTSFETYMSYCNTDFFDEYIDYIDCNYLLGRFCLEDSFLIRYKNHINFWDILNSRCFLTVDIIKEYEDKIDESHWSYISILDESKVSSLVYSKCIDKLDLQALYVKGVIDFDFIKDNINSIDVNFVMYFIKMSDNEKQLINNLSKELDFTKKVESSYYDESVRTHILLLMEEMRDEKQI